MKKRILLIALAVLALGMCLTFTSCESQLEYAPIGDGYLVMYCDESATEVVVPSTHRGKPVIAVSVHAFANCKNLTSIEIPIGVEVLGDEEVYKDIYSIMTYRESKKFTLVEIIICFVGALVGAASVFIPYCLYHRNKDGLTFERNLKGYTVKKCRKKATEIDIPKYFRGKPVTEIGEDAFEYCKRLTRVAIPNSITTIGRWAFAGCCGLKTVEIMNGVTHIGEHAFYYCRALTSIEIPNSVTTVGEGTFEDCENLTRVVIPNSVTSIGEHAFARCRGLTSIVIPNSVTTIGESAFCGCVNLTSIVIPNSVTTIEKRAFEDCENLTSTVIPNSVTTIGEGVFNWSKNLTSIEVDENNKHYESIDGNLYTKDGKTLVQYAQGKKDSKFVIPEGVTTIGAGAFENCQELTSIEIPNSVIEIGKYAFYFCNSLTSIEIPNSVTIIGDGAFEFCSSLKSIKIPSSVTTMGNFAIVGENNCVIYCEEQSQPAGWREWWNDSRHLVIWGHKQDN